jgi:hypothetical protein
MAFTAIGSSCSRRTRRPSLFLARGQYRKAFPDMLLTSMRECPVRFTEIDLFGVYVAPFRR